MRILPMLLLVGFLATCATAQAADRPCGSVRFAGKTLDLVAVGDGVTCRRARRIAGRPGCTVQTTPGRVSCFALLPPGPARVWYPSEALFPERPLVEARRRSCAGARVTRAMWRAARRHPGGFPNRTQLLADDLVRCKLLWGMRERAVLRLLGKPVERGKRELEYQTGQERDSIFQLDAEYLSVEFGHDGRVRSATFA